MPELKGKNTRSSCSVTLKLFYWRVGSCNNKIDLLPSAWLLEPRRSPRVLKCFSFLFLSSPPTKNLLPSMAQVWRLIQQNKSYFSLHILWLILLGHSCKCNDNIWAYGQVNRAEHGGRNDLWDARLGESEGCFCSCWDYLNKNNTNRVNQAEKTGTKAQRSRIWTRDNVYRTEKEWGETRTMEQFTL